jgi:SNF2 family DNA or RNA helicase
MLTPDYISIYYNKNTSNPPNYCNDLTIKILKKAQNGELKKKGLFRHRTYNNVIVDNTIIISIYYRLPNVIKVNDTIYDVSDYNIPNDNICIDNKLAVNNTYSEYDVYFVDYIAINELHPLYNELKKVVSNIDIVSKKKVITILSLINYKEIIKHDNINSCINFINEKYNNTGNSCLENNIDLGLSITSYAFKMSPNLRDSSVFFKNNNIKNIDFNKLYYLYYLSLCNGFDFKIGRYELTKTYILGSERINSLTNDVINKIKTNGIQNNKLYINYDEYYNVYYNGEDNLYDLKPVLVSHKYSDEFNDNYTNKLTLPLFEYQQNNVKWMSYIEDTKPEFNTYYKLSLEFNNTLSDISYIDKYNFCCKLFKNVLEYKIPVSTLKDNEGKNYVRYLNVEAEHITGITYSYDYDENTNLRYSISDDLSNDEINQQVLNGKIKMHGGIIADDVGLGKTLSTIAFLANKRDEDRNAIKHGLAELSNMIILPNRLVEQWKHEISKYLVDKDYFNIATIGTITDVKKLSKKTPEELKSIDIFLVSNTIFGNEKYIKDYVISGNGLNLIDTKWNRIIIDEAHELLVVNTIHNYANNIAYYTNHYNYTSSFWCSRTNNILTKKERTIAFNIIYNLKSNYRWCLTATPFMYEVKNFIAYLYWLSDIKLNTTYKENKIISSSSNDYTISKYNPEYINNVYAGSTKKFSHHNNEKLNALYNLLTDIDFNNFMDKYVSKNNKKTLQQNDIIDIPIVSEEVIYVNQSDIEKQIYNSYADDVMYYYGSEHNRISLLFKLCTNLLVSNLFNMSTLADTRKKLDNLELLSLDEINNRFINNIKTQITKTKEQIKGRTDKIKHAKGDILKSSKIIQYFSEITITEYLELMMSVFELYIDTEQNIGSLKDELSCKSKKTTVGLENFVNKTDMKIINSFIDNYSNYTTPIIEILSNSSSVNDFMDLFDNKDKLIEIISTYLSYLDTSRSEYKYIHHVNIINKFIALYSTKCNGKIERAKEAINKLEYSLTRLNNQLHVMDDEDFIKERVKDPCIICLCDYEDDTEIIITKCRHIMCAECFNMMMGTKSVVPCPECRGDITIKDITKTCIKPVENSDELEQTSIIQENDNEYAGCINKYGSKMALLIKYLKNLFNTNNTNRAIIFSQYDEMLSLIKQVLIDYDIKYVFCKGNVNVISKNIMKFKTNPEYRVILLSSDKANSGSNLTEASHIIFIDVLNMEKQHAIDVETQAIGRAVRLGQKKSVKVVRFITRNTIEETKYLENKYDLIDE